jgi:hypothetical protein
MVGHEEGELGLHAPCCTSRFVSRQRGMEAPRRLTGIGSCEHGANHRHTTGPRCQNLRQIRMIDATNSQDWNSHLPHDRG